MAKLLANWARHSDVDFQGDQGTVPVLGFHCDGVQYTSSKKAGSSRSIVAGSINFISAASAELRHKRQPLFMLRKARLCKCGCSGFHTIQEVMEAFAWSLGCFAKGLSPTSRHDGSPWSLLDRVDRMPGDQPIPVTALLQVRGDWEWYEQCFRLRSTNSDAFCWMCNATRHTVASSSCALSWEQMHHGIM